MWIHDMWTNPQRTEQILKCHIAECVSGQASESLLADPQCDLPNLVYMSSFARWSDAVLHTLAERGDVCALFHWIRLTLSRPPLTENELEHLDIRSLLLHGGSVLMRVPSSCICCLARTVHVDYSQLHPRILALAHAVPDSRIIKMASDIGALPNTHRLIAWQDGLFLDMYCFGCSRRLDCESWCSRCALRVTQVLLLHTHADAASIIMQIATRRLFRRNNRVCYQATQPIQM